MELENFRVYVTFNTTHEMEFVAISVLRESKRMFQCASRLDLQPKSFPT